ncbi:hypothetical protein BKA19_3841 [Blastococcus saxobsidens]|uniref:Uncharacterized protein n=2 Tax=Blastococcus saxobsidens TaxID=138336 RepID=A0A4Q7YA84_9ACTN|nr:hypothetical protein BKA19_3841 [Blastococcus saxobsidens]
MQLAYERFLQATALPSAVRISPLMVSRLVAVRPTLQRSLEEGLPTLLPAATAALTTEFRRGTIADVFRAVTGVSPEQGDQRWNADFTPAGLLELLRQPHGAAGATALAEQAQLFTRHLREVLGDRRTAVLVDTGLFGTTQDLLAEGLPDLNISCALMVRSLRPKIAGVDPRTFGLSVEAFDYSPIRARTAVLRYWHYIEWLFEPDLPSVRTFVTEDGRVRSNLEVTGWPDRVEPAPESAFAGVLHYLDGLGPGPAEQISADADRAWRRYRRIVVWPHREDGDVLAVGTRSHDFGRAATWDQPTVHSVVAALRGNPMWREGEVARSGSPFRAPLLLALEAAHAARLARRMVRRGRRTGPGEPLQQ